MSDLHFTKRINAQLISQNAGFTVRLVGRVKSQTGNIVHLTSSDEQAVMVTQVGQVTSLPIGDVVEVLGTIDQDRTITMTAWKHFPGEFDMNLYNEMVLLANGRCAALFSGSE